MTRHMVGLRWAGVLLGGMSVIPAISTAQHLAAVEHPVERLASAEQVLAKPVTVRLERATLEDAVKIIVANAGIRLQYQSELFDGIHTLVTLHADRMPLGMAMDRVLSETGLNVVVLKCDLITIRAGVPVARSGGILGRVTDMQTKRPLEGVTILLDDGQNGVKTGAEGKFLLPGVSAGSHRITARLLGYAKHAQTVMVTDGAEVIIELELQSSANTLEQVVVTGTVIPTELKAVPSAITVITAKQLEERGITHIDQLFRGDVPGLFAQNQGAKALLDEVTMYSRGATGLSSASAGVTPPFLTNPIKTYVDGVEMADSKYLSQIDPKSIERIEILAGPQASTIYGSNALNGVMQIFTKRGTTSTPQFTLSLLSGWVENNFSRARTPQHDDNAQLSGIEGRLSYNAGGSWNYMGPWTPAKQLSRWGTFGGARIELPTPAGRVVADVTLRRSITQSVMRGSADQTYTGFKETGWYANLSTAGIAPPQTSTLTGQTLGATLSYAPAAWWSHELGVGQDGSDIEARVMARGYRFVSDSTLSIQQSHADRRAIHYTTTANLPIASLAKITVTAGADAWQNLTSSWLVRSQTLTGSLTGSTSISRQSSHNAGGFLQTQLGLTDRLFLTYGLRAEWNPNFGADAQPNYAPRYGVAYTQDIGTMTAKLRSSYGRSTRPPTRGLKIGQTIAESYSPADWSSYASALYLPYYGIFDYIFANPELAPEHQQGGEGGLELYFGTRGSLVITRYNQTIDGLIDRTVVDSVRTLVPCAAFTPECDYSSLDADGYGYRYQNQYVNLASIRNQGWEVQGSMVVGPITTRGTYSWTKSRTLGVIPRYRAFFTPQDDPQYQPGATFKYLPEHTWALGMTYARAATSIGFNAAGPGKTRNSRDDFYFRNLVSDIRLLPNRFRASNADSYINFNPSYALIDLMGSHRFSSRIEGVLQVQNLADHYANDYDAAYASLGRQLKTGIQIRTR